MKTMPTFSGWNLSKGLKFYKYHLQHNKASHYHNNSKTENQAERKKKCNQTRKAMVTKNKQIHKQNTERTGPKIERKSLKICILPSTKVFSLLGKVYKLFNIKTSQLQKNSLDDA